MWNRRPLLFLVSALAAAPALGVDWSGFVAFESRAFFSGDGESGQTSESQSVVLQPELYWEWDEGDQTVRFTPFLRWDQRDDERTHADVRELYWLKASRGWELAIGIRKVFWGVTESAHLVDVLNQTDLVEDLDGEQKLGQPAVQLSLIRSWGTVDLFLLPGFRERTFPGEDGRLRTRPAVDADRAEYESSAGRDHVDWAVRWSHSAGVFDVGVSHFSGTGRDPLLLPAGGGGEAVLKPFYEQVDQTGLDLQATVGPWLWKLEAISRWSERQHFAQALGGFEFTFFDVRRTGIDVGLLAEYFIDERDRVPDSIFVGSRLTFNDVQSTDVLLGGVVSADGGGTLLNLEASRRLLDRWRLSVRLRAFVGVADDSFLRPFREDDYLELELSRFF